MVRQIVGIIGISALASCGKVSPQGTQSNDQQRTSETAEYEPSPSDSGGRIGNGGSGIVCLSEKRISKIELFDFYENDQLRRGSIDFDYTPDLSKPLMDQALETAQQLIDQRWRQIDPLLANHLTEKLRKFKADSILLDAPMPLINDVGSKVAPPPGCFRVQIANQNQPKFADDHLFTIQKKLFEHPAFSNLHRAGLIVHELIYSLTKWREPENSIGARKMTSIFFTSRYKEFIESRKRYFEISQSAGMPWAGFGSVAIRFDRSFAFHNENQLFYGWALPGSKAATKFGEQTIGCQVEFNLDQDATSFSIVSKDDYTAKIHGISMPGVEGVFSLLGGHYISRSLFDWDNYLPTDYCKENNGSFDYHKTEKFEYFSAISPCIQIKRELPTVKIDACVKSNVVFRKDAIYPVSGAVEEGRVIFPTNNECKIDHISTILIWVHRCVASFRNNQGDEQSFVIAGPMNPLNDRITVTLDEQSEHFKNHKAGTKEIQLAFKPGSQLTLDNSSNILLATVVNEVKICTSKGGEAIVPANSYVSFDGFGCADSIIALPGTEWSP